MSDGLSTYKLPRMNPLTPTRIVGGAGNLGRVPVLPRSLQIERTPPGFRFWPNTLWLPSVAGRGRDGLSSTLRVVSYFVLGTHRRGCRGTVELLCVQLVIEKPVRTEVT